MTRDSVKPDVILCHYGEIGVKGKNLRFFEERLRDNIRSTLDGHCPGTYASVRRVHRRILVTLSEGGRSSVDEVSGALKNVFGLAYFAFAVRSRQNLDDLKKDSIRVLSPLKFETFRITARRGDKSIPFTSRSVNETVGAHVVGELGKKVQLKEPDVTCYVDLFQKSAFIYTRKVPGPGGLPVGVSGKVVGMISGGIDSPLACHYAMKRGAQVVFVHFHSVPYTNRASIDKVMEVVQLLRKFQITARLFLVKLAPIQEEIMVNTPARFRVLLYRRFMFRIGDAIARQEKAHALVTGESLGQVASQTLENMEVIEVVTDLPVLRPLVGLDKQEIVDQAQGIGTYAISIQPDQDCCSVFVPRHPATRSSPEEVARAEVDLDVNRLVDEAVRTAKVETFTG
ncbi:MAG: tRNA uracil 4-sulfurtransferase ThiI [Fidelibacterota bacterium]